MVPQVHLSSAVADSPSVSIKQPPKSQGSSLTVTRPLGRADRRTKMAAGSSVTSGSILSPPITRTLNSGFVADPIFAM